MKRTELENDTWSLALAPAWGGRVTQLKANGLDILTPIIADSFDPVAWPKGGIYPLMPYSNRIRDGQLTYGGVTHLLPAHPAALPHTLHGVAHTLAWQVTDQSRDSVTLACEYAGEHWPWPVRFEQRFMLKDDQLVIDIAVTNLGISSMPAGLGLHPYFHRHPGMRAELSVARSWRIDDGYLPDGTSRSQPHAVVIVEELKTELALYGSEWDGFLKLSYPTGHLTVQTQAPLTHFVAFAPEGAAYVCLEPVSHLADAFNSPPESWAAQGTHILEPGQTLAATLTFTWRPN